MYFRKLFEKNRLRALLDTMDNEINESFARNKLESAIKEFEEIEKFDANGMKSKDGNISIYGTYYGGERGAKHITLDISKEQRDKVLKWLNKNLKKINSVI